MSQYPAPGQPNPYQQQQPANQPYPEPGVPGQPLPAQPGPTSPPGVIALTIQGSVMTSSMIVPSVKINGYPFRAKYGRQDIPVHPGPIRVEAYAEWMRTYGQATLDFTIEPGQIVPVFYAAPFHQFTTGSIGFEQQKRKGTGALIAVITIPVLLVILMVIAAVLAGL